MEIGEVLVTVADALATAQATAEAETLSPPEVPEKATLTQRVLVHMLRENTGASILDSGSAYGRNWQRNQLVDFFSRPRSVLKGEGEWLNVTHDIFHWLDSRLEYSRAMTRKFRKFAALPENADKYALDLMQEFPAWYAERSGEPVGGFYGEGNPITDNSCNHEELLSQAIQYTYFTVGDENREYVLLQIHGGADLRGGYTDPQVFEVSEETAIFDYAKGEISPAWEEVKELADRIRAEVRTNPSLFPGMDAELLHYADTFHESAGWYTDDGCNWYERDGSTNEKHLEDYPHASISDKSAWIRGSLCFLPNGDVLCPITGCRLEASFCP